MLTVIVHLVRARYWTKNLSVFVCFIRANTYIEDGPNIEILKPGIHFVCS